MDKIFTKRLFFLALFTIFTLTGAFAQTITIGNVDPGPYGQGSTIAVPFNINDAGGCIQQNNTFNLYLSDAAGNFPGPAAPIGTFTGFYTSFINGIIPAGTPAGANYKVIIKSTSPAVTSAPSAAFSINANPAVTAAVSSSIISPTYPEVFGSCNGTPNTPFAFKNASTAGSVVTATFFNEQTQTNEVSNAAIPAAGYTFTAGAATNYTILVKAKDATGTVGTHAYTLLNNVINTAIGSTGSLTVCLINGKGDLTINIDVSSPTGIQFNYPGNLYTLSWGDGSNPDVLTLCDIKAKNGQITHTFTKASCGNSVVFQASNLYCGNIGSAPTNNAKVIIPPTNLFKVAANGCTGVPIDIPNMSDPGIDPNTCAKNAKALYTWLVDGVIVSSNFTLSQDFILPATTPAGPHTITLQLQNSSGGCSATDFSLNICLQNPPKPAFTIPTTAICLASGPLIPVDKSVVDPGCNSVNQYTWTVSPATFTYSGGTNSNSTQPQFKFTTPGVYTIQLAISSASCGNVLAPAQTIVVDGTPIATLSPDASLCGSNQILTFDPTIGPTKTTLTGTAQSQPNTYTWSVTGGAFSFQGGTTANSQYPQILFTDFATYTVTVTQKNSCGNATATQHLSFQQAPTVTAGNPQTICQGGQAALNGKIVGNVNSFQWVGGTGTFTVNRTTLVTNYIPSATEISAGQVTLTLQGNTSLAAPCNTITSNVTITIIPTDLVTSAPAESICTGQSVNYQIIGSNQSSNFTWTASLTSGTATGFTAAGSGNTINDVLINTNPTTNAVVTYKITPQSNSCNGTPFTFTVTVNPLPKITAVPVNSPICSNQPADITLTSNIPNTSYTWTSVATAGIVGNTNQSNAVVTTGIQDIINNNASTIGTVTYTITPYNGSCPGPAITASITVQPLPITSKPGPDDEVCSTTTYTLQGNDPSPGTGKWIVTKGPAGVTFSDDTKPNAVVSGLVPGNLYQFQWTITATPNCPSNSNAVNITIDKATIGGTTTGDNTVCSGSGSGQITLTGQFGNILRWESSIDNGTTWVPIVNVSTTQLYSNLTQTTQYRTISQNGNCSALPSSVTTIKVNPPTIIANAGTDQTVCNLTTAILNGNDPTPFNGVWTQTAGPVVTIVNPTSHQTQVTGLVKGNTYTFMWTIKGLPPCGDSQASVNVSAFADVTASYTQDKTQGCGPTTVTFTNTSTPSPVGTFQWDFGDGSAVVTAITPPPHVFAPSVDGKEVTYTITMTPVSNCGLKTPFTSTIKVSPQVPVARLFPSQTAACGAFTLTAQNLSPGNNVSYDFYLVDAGGNIIQHLQYPDTRDAVFQAVNPSKVTDYSVYLTATDQCGNKGTSTPITISISPSSVISLMQIKGDPQSVCLGNSVTFQNVSTGGDRFTYTIYDANKNIITTIPGGAGDMNYTPTATGTYYVSITAGNNGCGDAPVSPMKQFSVYPDPQPNFTYTLDNDYNVTFTNTTPDDSNTPASSLSYKWDFGDGSANETTYEPKAHPYDYEKSPFTVTLTAINAASSCLGVKTQTVIVKFLGNLFLPNAFLPNSTNSELNVFKAKGTAIKQWHMQIFNNFGELVWETTKLDSNGSPTEGWDGSFKGLPAQQGVYVWQVSATFINGTEWKGMSYNHSLPKRTGSIHLIR